MTLDSRNDALMTAKIVVGPVVTRVSSQTRHVGGPETTADAGTGKAPTATAARTRSSSRLDRDTNRDIVLLRLESPRK
jgi:hypothetical protein